MAYFGAAVGTFIGMMIGLGIFSNSWRLGFLPRDYDFVHMYGKAIVNTDRKAVTYLVRSLFGMLLHPVVFVYFWGETGFLGLSFGNTVLSGMILLLVESILFGLAIWFDVINVSPDNLKIKVIPLQMVSHMITGVTMGYFFNIL